MFFPVQGKAQIYINEFLASNSDVITDPDFNESADWLELYNAENVPVNVGGYFISDNFDNKDKWQIPENTWIGAGSFLIIWADSRDQGLHASFNISASGEELAIFSKDGSLVDSVSFGIQNSDISMGRIPDGGKSWGYFAEPTPEAENNTEVFEGTTNNTPHFTPLGGIYQNAVTVNISNTFGGEIRYTLDGSEPLKTSALYNSSIQIDSTTLLRARIFQPGNIPGRIITHSYFIDSENEIGSLPVVSIATNPENFWDSIQGIYVQDFKPDWEVPINIELFENDGSDRAAFNLQAGTKINGLYSWQLPQKMLGVYFRKKYGEGKLDYPILFDKERNSYQSFALRASGSDWAYSLFRDGMTQSLTAENMDVDYQSYRPAVLFVNGKYMGINNIRAKVDDDLIIQSHNLLENEFDMVENENYAEAGSLDQYVGFDSLYHRDLSVQANFDTVATLMDIENFTDFVITEIYSQNTSVDHNIMAWKPKIGGKWKWILNDLDRGFFNPDENLIDFYAGKDVIPLNHLLNNEGYKKYFGKRLADHLFTTFDPLHVKKTIELYKNRIENEVPKHIIRWQGTSSKYGDPIYSYDYWESQINRLKRFADERPNYLLNDLINYGFEQSTPLTLNIYPANSGIVDFNSIKITQKTSNGAYPEKEEIVLYAQAKSGYEFKGWKLAKGEALISKEENWKFFDKGFEPDSNWQKPDFDDSSWIEGKAALGDGDDDENTVVSFGEDRRNKHITTYFRKSVSVENIENITELLINLKCDDGAVVYINGLEVFRLNMPDGEINFETTSNRSIAGSDEDKFTLFELSRNILLPGNNVVAVEVHQDDPRSSDISFDLEMVVKNDNEIEFYSKASLLNYIHSGNVSITAVFESDGSCILPELISEDITLSKDCSPYRVPNNVLVADSVSLTIKPGVELWFSDDVTMTVNGKLNVKGTYSEPVVFTGNPESEIQKWGILNFVNADTSILKNMIIEGASKGKHPLRENAAVSVFNSVLKIDSLVIDNVHENPVLGRYADISMTNTKLHSKVTGDLINVKYGKAFIDNCTFRGNTMPDTDAIDYDDVKDGIIKNSVIYDFYGFNSDGIDIGEKAKNVSVENVLVYNISDKGISVGQQSTVKISNSIFVNCNLGAGIKDSSRVYIDHCTYYGNGTPIAVYEKNIGDAGGNVVVSNSILSNAYDATVSADDKSTLEVSYSASDNDILSSGNNLFTDPEFKNPNLFDFELEATSACLGTASDGNMGAGLNPTIKFSQLFISAVAYSSDANSEVNEFIELTNPGSIELDIAGYEFTKGISYKFPEKTIIEAGEKIYVTYNAGAGFWLKSEERVFQWESGRLADEGETVQLQSPYGIVIDKIHYKADDSWPEVSDNEGIKLAANNLDNHFGKNWISTSLNTIVNVNEDLLTDKITGIYPNPTTGILYISNLKNKDTLVEVFNLHGVLIKSEMLNASHSQINISEQEAGIYIVRAFNSTRRIVLLK